MNKTPPVIHPFMFGAMFLFSCFHKIQPFTNWQELLGILAVMLGVIYGIYRGLRHFFPVGVKASILTTLCVLFFCYFGYMEYEFKRFAHLVGWPDLARSRYALLVLGAFFATSALLVIRTRRELRGMKIYLNIATSLAFAFTVFQIFTHPLPVKSRRHTPLEPPEQGPLVVPANSPDIYYILLDGYTSAESLQAYWGYDNSEFVNFLTSHGFQVVKNAHGNSDYTTRCMAGSLNMEHPPQRLQGMNDYAVLNLLWEVIERARVPRKLEQAGYRIVNLSLFDLGEHKQFYEFPYMDYNTLGEVFLNESVIGYWRSYYLRHELKNSNRRVLSALHEAAAASGTTKEPRFIYAHFEMPHPPFFYDRHGKPLNRGFGQGFKPEDYLEYLIYGNHLMTNVVSDILAKAKTPPIIILQGDHGFRALPGTNHTAEAMTILNAYHLPGAQPGWVYEGITPVNSFRMIFNRYFGMQYPYRPDLQLPDKPWVEPPGERAKD